MRKLWIGWDEVPKEYKLGEDTCIRHETHGTDYGPVTIALVCRKNEEQPRYMKVKFRPENLVSLIKRKFGFDTVQEFELGIAKLERLREVHGFSDNYDQMDKNLCFLKWRAHREFGRNSPIHKALGQIQFRRTIQKSDNIDLSEVYN